MYQLVFEIALILAAFLLGSLTPFLRDVIHDLRAPSHDWRAVVKGAWKSRVGLLFTAIPLCILLVGAALLHNAEIESERQRTIEIISSINQTNNERDDKLIEAINNQTDAILKAIQQIGGENGQ